MKNNEYITIENLTNEQKEQLKINYLDEKLMETENRNISYGEMANINDLVSDEEIIEAYGHISFVKEDFWNYKSKKGEQENGKEV